MQRGRESAEGDGSWGRRVTSGADDAESFCCWHLSQLFPQALGRRINLRNRLLLRQKSAAGKSAARIPKTELPRTTLAGTATPKEEPPKEEKKDESPNPAQAAAEKTKEVTVQAAVATKNLGQAALIKARDWESGWLTGTYVGAGRTIVPMTPKQRREIYLEQTLTSPGAYLKRMFAAGIDQARGSPYQWDGGWQGYGERFASREGQFITSNTLAYLGNSALKYEPRYDQCRCSGFWPGHGMRLCVTS